MTRADRLKWWSQLSTREKGLCVLTLGAVCYAFVVFLYHPRLAERERLSSRMTNLRQEITALSSTLATLRQKTSSGGEKIHIQGVGLIDSGPRLSRLLHKIHRQARVQRVELLEIKPNVPENRDSYRMLPLEIKTRSRFQDLGLYLLSLERLSDPVVIDRIIIRSDPQTSPEVVAEMTLHVYKRGEA